MHGDWTLSMRPELGAAIASLTWRDHEILRPAVSDAQTPLDMGSFPLTPYANRIDRGRFTFADREVALPPTPGFEPHALHGVGWLKSWSVIRTGIDVVDLALAVEASPDWPWAWTASHSLRLDRDGLEMGLAITNQDEAPMPAGLGLHPYFLVEPETILMAPAARVWANRADEIPEQLVPAADIMDWSEGATVTSAPFVDNAYADWSGHARLVHADHEVRVTASANARWLQIYAPSNAEFACVEPVTHRPNAQNAPADEDAGLVTLAPGQALSMSMRIEATSIGDHP